MKKLYILLFLCISFRISYAQEKKITKHALIIAIGDYPDGSGWGDISSVNDVPLINEILLKQGFNQENITKLIDSDATYNGIKSLFNETKKKLNKGDILMIHYSGHGQQIADNNGDESDDMDEAIVPHDAMASYSYNYEGENHFRDDELGEFFNQFRNELGIDGQLFVTFDSCHSGSATRGFGKTRGGKAVFAKPNWKPKKSEKPEASDMMEKTVLESNAAPFIFLSGASANELNYEYKSYGSLSYALSKAFNQLGNGFTYKQLFAKVSSVMYEVSRMQTPTVEGNLNSEVFGNIIIESAPSFTLNKIEKGANKIVINGGKVHQLFKGTTVIVTSSIENNPTDKNTITTGVIEKSENFTATIKLDQILKGKNIKDFKVFIDEYFFDQIKVTAFIDKKLNKKNKEEIINKFKESSFVEFTKDSENADLFITKDENEFVLQNLPDNVVISNNENLDELDSSLFDYAQGFYLKSLHMKNTDFQIEVELLKVDENNKYIDNNGITPVFNTSDDKARLKVTNNGNKTLYFAVIEINSKGKWAPFIPNEGGCSVPKDDTKLAPGKSTIISYCDVFFGPPSEKIVLKAFASNNPISFLDLRSRGPNNPLEGIIKKSDSRGPRVQKANVEGYSTEFVFEIKETVDWYFKSKISNKIIYAIILSTILVNLKSLINYKHYLLWKKTF